jgi:hypothetical protein
MCGTSRRYDSFDSFADLMAKAEFLAWLSVSFSDRSYCLPFVGKGDCTATPMLPFSHSCNLEIRLVDSHITKDINSQIG